jgi:hypothetical protein
MDREYIREHQVIERYLRGGLTPDEERAFEEAYVGDPKLLDEIELVERLQQGVKDLGAAGAIDRPTADGGTRPSWLFSKQWAMAASLLLVVSLAVTGNLYRENASLRQEQPLSAGVNTRLLPVLTLRGAPETVLEAPEADDWAVLLVDPSFTQHDSYRAVVTRISEQQRSEIWSVGGLEPEYQDQLAIGMPGRLLMPGQYEIAITGRMNDWPADRAEPVSQIPLRIVTPNAP